eukprot:COSAG06_NODE_8467_length_2163_cov_3.223353_1_plen_143_part_00
MPFGLKHFWLDCDEPCQSGVPHSYGAMPAAAVGAAYPHMLAMATREAMGPVGANGSVMLGRSAWAGTQRLGAAVWSGDTDSSWVALNGQVRAALNMAMSGIVCERHAHTHPHVQTKNARGSIVTDHCCCCVVCRHLLIRLDE